MLGHFPSPHPDELLYGVCARLSERANVPSKKGFCQTLFGAASIAVVDLPSRLEFLAKQLPSGGPNAETLLRNHTLLPLYLPFLPKERAGKMQAGRSWRWREKPAVSYRCHGEQDRSAHKPPALPTLCC
jgi:hypothetical protein